MKRILTLYFSLVVILFSQETEVCEYIAKPWLVKLDSLGDTIWTKAFDKGYEGLVVKETKDSGYVMATRLGIVYKVNSKGDSLWQVETGITPGWFDCLCMTADNSCVLTGSVRSKDTNKLADFTSAKIDSSGRILWSRTYNLGHNPIGMSVIESSDGGCVVVGVDLFKSQKLFLVKTNSDGDSLWSLILTRARGTHLVETKDKGYLFAGNRNEQMFIAKTDSAGRPLWLRSYGQEYSFNCANCLLNTADSGYLIRGWLGKNPVFLKINSQGDSLWCNPVSLPGTFLQPARDGNYVVASSVGYGESSNLVVVRCNDKGDIIEEWTYEVPGDDQGNFIVQTSDGDYVVTGYRDKKVPNYREK